MKTAMISKLGLGEPHPHAMMRQAKMFLLYLLILALIATVLLLLFFRPAAYLAALAVTALLVCLVIVGFLERQSTIQMLRSTDQSSITKEEEDMGVQYAAILTAITLIMFSALAATLVATSLVEDWAMVGVVAAALFLLSILLMFPYLTLFLVGAEREERDKVDRDAKLRRESNE